MVNPKQIVAVIIGLFAIIFAVYPFLVANQGNNSTNIMATGFSVICCLPLAIILGIIAAVLWGGGKRDIINDLKIKLMQKELDKKEKGKK